MRQANGEQTTNEDVSKEKQIKASDGARGEEGKAITKHTEVVGKLWTRYESSPVTLFCLYRTFLYSPVDDNDHQADILSITSRIQLYPSHIAIKNPVCAFGPSEGAHGVRSDTESLGSNIS